MGLTITGYSHLERIVTSSHQLRSNVFFINKKILDHLSPNECGMYRMTAHCKTERLYSSYGDYNHWRTHLCWLLHGYAPSEIWDITYLKEPLGPFVELINFTDCDGWIGPRIASFLNTDFKQFREVIRQRASSISKKIEKREEVHDDFAAFSETCFIQLYDLFAKITQLTDTGNGYIRFH